MPAWQSQEPFEVRQEKEIYQELGLESLQLCRWYRKLYLFYKVFKNEHLKYLFHLIPVRCTPYATRTEGNIALIKTKHNFFKNYVKLYAIYFYFLQIIQNLCANFPAPKSSHQSQKKPVLPPAYKCIFKHPYLGFRYYKKNDFSMILKQAVETEKVDDIHYQHVLQP